MTVFSRQKPGDVMKLLSSGVEAKRSLDSSTYYDAIINLAGAGIMDERWTDSRKKVLISSRVGLTLELVNFLERMETRPQVLISGSAIGYYGPGEAGQVFNELSPGGSDFSASLCSRWEEAAQKAESMGIRVCRVRTGVVLHPKGGALQQMLPPFRLGLGGPMGSGKQIMSWIHLDDMVNILMFLLKEETSEGPYNATAPFPVSNQEFAETLGRVLGRPAILTVPGVALKVMLGESSDLLLKGQKVLPERLEAAGFKFEYPKLEPALCALLRN